VEEEPIGGTGIAAIRSVEWTILNAWTGVEVELWQAASIMLTIIVETQAPTARIEP
jgi:hypothetical protein